MGKVVCLAVPFGTSGISHGTFLGIERATLRDDVLVLHIRKHSSLLPECFNHCWAEALNCRKQYGVTHFAMLHADIAPQAGWLDVLLDELERLKADLVSCVVPIKDARGLTSTGAGTANPWSSRRLSLQEIHTEIKKPSFCSEDVAEYGSPLLVNTGCWCCRFTEDWVEEVRFHEEDRIIQHEGRFHAAVQSEDWLFSRWLHERGLRYYATTTVRLSHQGVFSYPNDEPWGTQASDWDVVGTPKVTPIQPQFIS